MTAPTEANVNEQPMPAYPSAERGHSQSGQGLDPADAWQDYIAKQSQLEMRKIALGTLQGQLRELCADIVENGSNAEKIYQVRMLEACLRQHRRQVDLAKHELDAAGRHLGRKQTARRSAQGTPARGSKADQTK